jgi:hypothetical protein
LGISERSNRTDYGLSLSSGSPFPPAPEESRNARHWRSSRHCVAVSVAVSRRRLHMYVTVERLRFGVPGPWDGYGYENGEREGWTDTDRQTDKQMLFRVFHKDVASIMSR